MNEIIKQEQLDDSIVESIILKGDISGLSSKQKIQYYKIYCSRLGLDPQAQPFKILKLQGKETLYLDRSGAQQLNKLHNVSHEITSREKADDLYIVTAKASSNGRYTESIGAVNISALKGDNLANAMMKAETKAKRRSTLDLLGLGILDETEIETIPKAEVVSIEDVEKPSIRDLKDQISKCETIDQTKELHRTMTDDEKKAYRELLTNKQVAIVEANIEERINTLKSNTWKTNETTIMEVIYKETGERKQHLINILKTRLTKLGIDWEYQELPWEKENG